MLHPNLNTPLCSEERATDTKIPWVAYPIRKSTATSPCREDRTVITFLSNLSEAGFKVLGLEKRIEKVRPRWKISTVSFSFSCHDIFKEARHSQARMEAQGQRGLF
jgi:hypothetical protein